MRFFLPGKHNEIVIVFFLLVLVNSQSRAQQRRVDCSKIILDTIPGVLVEKSEGDNRIKYFNDRKYEILNKLTQDNSKNNVETKGLYIQNKECFRKLLCDFLNLDNVDGMRIYFASRMKEINHSERENIDSAGKFAFVFTPTEKVRNEKGIDCGAKQTKNSDQYWVYKYNKKKFLHIYKSNAKSIVHHYQGVSKKREGLDTTFTESEIQNYGRETKHVWLSLQKMKEFIGLLNLKYIQDNTTGVKLRLISYTDQDSVNLYGKNVCQTYRKRLTVDFVFTDARGEDVYIPDSVFQKLAIGHLSVHSALHGVKKLDIEELKNMDAKVFVERFSKILNQEQNKKLQKSLAENSLDTMDPTPPPPGIQAELDI